MKKPRVNIYCDGSCLGNPGPGGYAALLVTEVAGKKTERLVSGSASNTTNNQMELRAAIFGLSHLTKPCTVIVHSDSSYVVKGMTEWMLKWRKQHFKNSAGKPVANRELWEELVQATVQHEVSWQWVKAHNGHPENELVDETARQAALNGVGTNR